MRMFLNSGSKEEKLIQPQFHGREHVNVYCWMRKLKEGDKPLLDAFDLGFLGYSEGFILPK
jgi:hypothetical protein